MEATNTNGCIARDTVQVTILGSAPIADFDINLLTCTNSWDTYEDLSVSTDASTITAWEWDFGDGQISTAAQGIHNYVVSGNYPVSLKVTASNGCEQTLEKMVVVNTPPQVNFTTQFSCQGEAIKFNGTQSTSEFMTSWQWDFDDVNSNDNQAIGQNTQHIFADYGDHWVQLIGTDINGCSDTLQQMKSILPQPIPDFTFEDGCEKSNIVFTNASIMPEGGLIQGYNWNFGNGLGSQFPNPQAMYNNAGTYDVYLKVLGGNGCNNDTTMQINIHSLPAIAHLVEQDCAGIPVLFYDNSTANGDAIAQVQWRFNGGALKEGNPVSEVFSQEGPVAVQQIVTSDFGCKDSINYSVPIKSYLQAIFTTSPNTVIADVSFTIHNNSIGDVSHQFITQLGTTHQNDTSFIYTSDWLDSTVSIQLIIQNQHGCVDSTTQNFVVQNRNTDLAITNVISQEFNGYLKIGVEIKNNGSTPIQQAQLKLERVHDNPILEEWNGQLLAGESEVYIFHTMPLANVPLSDTANNYICVTGTITQPSQFLDEDLSNNQFCVTSSSTEMAIVETYPNPVKDELTIRIISQNEMNASITIYNEKGQTIQTVFQNQSLTKGLNTFIVDTQHWAKGVYLMKINQRIVKFVKG